MRCIPPLLPLALVVCLPATAAAQYSGDQATPAGSELFKPSTYCMACHNGLTTATGEDISFGTTWRSSMMAHSARDPYWQAGVRREILDHPMAQAAIENECSRCHMPMAHVQSQAIGRQQPVFASLGDESQTADPLAMDGVSCALCHQITSDRLGERSSFTGHFSVDTTVRSDGRSIFGPYDVEAGLTPVMRSATGFEQTKGTHIQQSELCATCHTLYTHTLDADGNAIGEFPEQVPYEEWLHSEFRGRQSCQSCHMPVVETPVRIASVLGEPRNEVSRHDFRGANFVVLGLLNELRAELGVVALPVELENAVARTRDFLQTSAATVQVVDARPSGDRIVADIEVRNLTGHKLPTAYPSRRVWLRVALKDAGGRVLFTSGGLEQTGAIAGNDNDRDPTAFEPHYREISSSDQVQIYETILGNQGGQVTTGLLWAASYLKDNRVVPRGFDKATAPPEVAVHGDARQDANFTGGSDRVRYSMALGSSRGPYTLEAELWYQPIAYRWAENLRAYEAVEPQRFIRAFERLGTASAIRLASTTVTVPEAASRQAAHGGDDGARLFRTYCASCHGVTGRGNGPAAESLRRRPPDLTHYTARNGGVFPSERLREIVDGRWIPAHGDREMPVWGDAFRTGPGGLDAASVQARINAIVEHVRMLQERAAD